MKGDIPSFWCMERWVRSGTDIGNATSLETSLCSPLESTLTNWKKFGGDPLKKDKLKAYCAQWWLMYELEAGERAENGLLNYNIILQLKLFCRGMDKWGEVAHVDLFLRRDHETHKNIEC